MGLRALIGNDASTAKIAAVIIISAILFVPVYGKVISFIGVRTAEEKLGYLPQKEIIRLAALDHKSLISEWLFLKVIIYYGGRIDPERPAEKREVEYFNMFKFLDAATYTDPYNIDAYYFSQAVFAWEVGRVRELNYLLERGTKYRTWDYYLPFFLGFNNFYFLKDYKTASGYMEQAAKITGDPLLTNLAARFLYESDKTAIAISFLKFMIDNTWNDKVKAAMQVRLKALEAVDFLEKAIKRFNGVYQRNPGSIEEMVNRGIIDKLPEDPYDGRFYLDEKGRIRTTSKFAFGGMRGDRNKNRKSQ